MAVLFYITAALAAACSIGCVLARNIVRMAMCLFGTLSAVSILYFLLGATFLGAIQLIVYVGGTLVVVVFGIMLTNRTPGRRYVVRGSELMASVFLFVALFAGLSWLFLRAGWSGKPVAGGSDVVEIGRQLLTTYLVPFEVISVLLLAVMIGAAYLAKPEKKSEPTGPVKRNPS